MTHIDEVSDADLIRRLNVAADGVEKVSFERLSLRRGYEKLLREAALALSRRSASNTAGVQICATEGCGKAATEYFERGGVGSHHCTDCMTKINALSALEPIQAGGDEPVAFVNTGTLKHHVESGSSQTTAVLHRTQGALDGEKDTPLFTRPATPVSAEVTNERVDAAAKAMWDRSGNDWTWEEAVVSPECRSAVEWTRDDARAALATLDRGRG